MKITTHLYPSKIVMNNSFYPKKYTTDTQINMKITTHLYPSKIVMNNSFYPKKYHNRYTNKQKMNYTPVSQ